jgi:hypothetical protein
MSRGLIGMLCVGLMAVGIGCGSSEFIEVSGSVSVDGQPLKEGDISFVPLDKRFGGEGGKVSNGKFTMRARPGKNRIEIRANEVVPGKTVPSAAGPDAPPEPMIRSIVPPKYNEQSTLEEDVSAAKRTFTFDLKTK